MRKAILLSCALLAFAVAAFAADPIALTIATGAVGKE
jgi:hypothetical protein